MQDRCMKFRLHRLCPYCVGETLLGVGSSAPAVIEPNPPQPRGHRIAVTAEAAVDLFLLAMNLGSSLLFLCKHVLNPRFPPTIRVSLTTSQVLRRPPEVT